MEAHQILVSTINSANVICLSTRLSCFQFSLESFSDEIVLLLPGAWFAGRSGCQRWNGDATTRSRPRIIVFAWLISARFSSHTHHSLDLSSSVSLSYESRFPQMYETTADLLSSVSWPYDVANTFNLVAQHGIIFFYQRSTWLIRLTRAWVTSQELVLRTLTYYRFRPLQQ